MSLEAKPIIKIKNDIFDELRGEKEEVTYLVSMYFLLLTKADSLDTVESTLRMLREHLGYKANRKKEREKTAAILNILSEKKLIEIKRPGKKWNDRVVIQIEGRPAKEYQLVHPSNRNFLNEDMRYPTTVLSIYLLLILKSDPNWQGRSEKTRISIARLAEELDCHESAIKAGLDYLQEMNIVNKYSGSYNEDTQKRNTNIYYTYSWHAHADLDDKKKDNLEQDECFKRKEKMINLLENKDELPGLLLGKYSEEFQEMLDELKKDFTIKNLDINNKEAINKWKERYLGVASVDVITIINLNSASTNIQQRLLILVERYNAPLILFKGVDDIIATLKSRMLNIHKKSPNLKEDILEFNSIKKILKKTDNYKKYYDTSQAKIKNIISEDCPKLFSIRYNQGSDSNQREIDRLISNLSEGKTYKEILNQQH